jgi:hypothetical protein
MRQRQLLQPASSEAGKFRVIRAKTPASEEAGYNNSAATVQKVLIPHRMSTEPSNLVKNALWVAASAATFNQLEGTGFSP